MGILDNKDTSDIVSWLPNGRAFIIHNKTRFASEILPVYFKEAKYSSFARRMKRWGFILLIPCKQSCDDTYRSKSVYRHPLFLRYSKPLCLQIRPKPQKKYVKKHNHASTNRSASTASDPKCSSIFQSRNVYSLFPGTNGSATYPYPSVFTIEGGNRPTIDSPFERRLKENQVNQDLLIQEWYHHQQEVSAHYQYLQDSSRYKQLYESHVLRLFAQHQNELEIEAKLSALACQNLMLKTTRGNEMGDTMGLLPYHSY